MSESQNYKPIENENTLILSKDFIDSCVNPEEDGSYGDFIYSTIAFISNNGDDFDDEYSAYGGPGDNDWVIERVNNIMKKYNVSHVLAVGVTKERMHELIARDVR